MQVKAFENLEFFHERPSFKSPIAKWLSKVKPTGIGKLYRLDLTRRFNYFDSALTKIELET